MINKLRLVFEKIKWGSLLHTLQNIVLPVILLVLVNNNLVELAVALVFLSKWRMFAVQPHHWLANLRSGGVDLIVGVSLVVMMQAVADLNPNLNTVLIAQVVIGALYMLWLILIKPLTSPTMMSIQSLIAQTLGTMMLFWLANNLAEAILILLAWMIAYVSALHFFDAHEDQFKGVLTIAWALFVAQFSFIINRWLIGYEIAELVRISNAVIMIFTISYTMGTLYVLWVEERVHTRAIRQYGLILAIVTVSVIVLTNWDGAI